MSSFQRLVDCTTFALQLLQELRLEELQQLLVERQSILAHLDELTPQQLVRLAELDDQFLKEGRRLLAYIGKGLKEAAKSKEVLEAYRSSLPRQATFVDRAV